MEPFQPLLAAGEELMRRPPNLHCRSARKLRASSVRTSFVSIIAPSSHFGGEGQVERGRDSIGMDFGEDERRPDLEDVLGWPSRRRERPVGGGRWRRAGRSFPARSVVATRRRRRAPGRVPSVRGCAAATWASRAPQVGADALPCSRGAHARSRRARRYPPPRRPGDPAKVKEEVPARGELRRDRRRRNDSAPIGARCPSACRG